MKQLLYGIKNSKNMRFQSDNIDLCWTYTPAKEILDEINQVSHCKIDGEIPHNIHINRFDGHIKGLPLERLKLLTKPVESDLNSATVQFIGKFYKTPIDATITIKKLEEDQYFFGINFKSPQLSTPSFEFTFDRKGGMITSMKPEPKPDDKPIGESLVHRMVSIANPGILPGGIMAISTGTCVKVAAGVLIVSSPCAIGGPFVWLLCAGPALVAIAVACAL